MSTGGFELLVFGTADWNQAIATNQHYITAAIAPTASKSYFLESVGLRRPQIGVRDARRVINRIRRAAGHAPTGRELPPGLSVLSPVVIPFHCSATNGPNSILVRRVVSNWRSSKTTRILWTYNPVTLGLERDATSIVYHCVDLLAEFPRMPRKQIERGERRLARLGARAVASSARVRDHLENQGFTDVILWENVADVAIFGSAGREYVVQNHSLDHRQRAVFAGNFSSAKVDFELLERLLAAGIHLDLAGPIAEGGGSDRGLVERLVDQGAVYHGHLELVELAELFGSCSVGVIPYLINDYTRGVSPLKTYEYLASGLSVVSTALPGVRAVEGDICVARTADEFVSAVINSQFPSPATVSHRRVLADGHSWASRGDQARDLISELVGV